MKKIIIILAFVLILIVFVFGRKYYLNYSFKQNLISETINVPLRFQSDTTDVDISQLKGKYVVLYFWGSTDKNQLKGLENFQKICNSRLKNDDRVKMFTVYCNPDSESYSAGTEYLQANNLHVSVFSLDKNILLEQLKINPLPTVLIISPEWEIKFKGSSLDVAKNCILGLTYAM
jgi:cytochrome oxidase Cu insertion factor (SCO1/SenC/PrrC family)